MTRKKTLPPRTSQIKSHTSQTKVTSPCSTFYAPMAHHQAQRRTLPLKYQLPSLSHESDQHCHHEHVHYLMMDGFCTTSENGQKESHCPSLMLSTVPAFCTPFQVTSIITKPRTVNTVPFKYHQQPLKCATTYDYQETSRLCISSKALRSPICNFKCSNISPICHCHQSPMEEVSTHLAPTLANKFSPSYFSKLQTLTVL